MNHDSFVFYEPIKIDHVIIFFLYIDNLFFIIFIYIFPEKIIVFNPLSFTLFVYFLLFIVCLTFLILMLLFIMISFVSILLFIFSFKFFFWCLFLLCFRPNPYFGNGNQSREKKKCMMYQL